MLNVVKRKLQSKFYPLGVSALAPGLCTCIKSYRSLHVFFFEIALIFNRFHVGLFMGLFIEVVLTISSNGFALQDKMAAMPIYGKILQNLLLQNQENFEAES